MTLTVDEDRIFPIEYRVEGVIQATVYAVLKEDAKPNEEGKYGAGDFEACFTTKEAAVAHLKPDWPPRLTVSPEAVVKIAESLPSDLAAASAALLLAARAFEKAVFTRDYLLAGLEWNGDGYEWDPPDFDYRIHPGEAARLAHDKTASAKGQEAVSSP